jgi:tetratricopeptide (TPR) repeat protein
MGRTHRAAAVALACAGALAFMAPDAAAQRRAREADAVFEANNALAACSRAAGSSDASDRAVETCAEALRYRLNRENRIVTLINSGVVQLRRGDYAAAVAFYDEALRLDPDHAVALFNRGAALTHAQRYGEAVATLTRALGLGVSEPYKAYYYRGEARRALGDVNGAIEDFQTALTIAPDWNAARDALADLQDPAPVQENLR